MSATVSARVRRLWERARRLGMNVNEVARGLERRVRGEEVRWAVGAMDDISSRVSLAEDSSEVIRRARDRGERRRAGRGRGRLAAEETVVGDS